MANSSEKKSPVFYCGLVFLLIIAFVVCIFGAVYSTVKNNNESAYETQDSTLNVVEPISIHEAEPYKTYKVDNFISIRQGKSSNTERIGRIPVGANFSIYAQENGWGYTDYSGINGWVSLAYCERVYSYSSIKVEMVPENTEESGITVYITKTGECYHSEGCSYLRESKKVVSLEKAVKGYRPCSRCHPPVLD